MQKINHQNYVLVLKEVIPLFQNKSFDFLGLSLPPMSVSWRPGLNPVKPTGTNNNYKCNDYGYNYMKFYGRQDELSVLSRLYNNVPLFAVITGRRRLGKTSV